MKRYTGGVLTGPLLAPILECDVELPIEEVTDGFYRWLLRCSPFGNSNPEPVFVSRGVRLSGEPRIIKEKHICLQLERPGGGSVSALGWSRAIDWRARCLELSLGLGSAIDIAYRLRRNEHPQFGGVELEICDLRTSPVR
jgi:single-stranded-DNA-specific exonuclease